MTAATRLAIGVADSRLNRSAGPVDEHEVGDALDQLAVGDHVGTADVQAPARSPGQTVAARGQHRDDVALVDRRGAVATATPDRRAPACARPAGPGSETSATGRR